MIVVSLKEYGGAAGRTQDSKARASAAMLHAASSANVNTGLASELIKRQ
jgi:hypothetical protein